MQNKRGVDAIVATVLIIMITVAAVAILWAFVIPMVKDSLSSSTSEKASLIIETAGGYTVFDPITNYSFVQIKRGVDDVNLSKIRIIFFNGKETRSVVESNVPAVNTMKVYAFYLSEFGKPLKVSISPIFSNGKEGSVIGETSDVKTEGVTIDLAKAILVAGEVKNVGNGENVANSLKEGLVGYWPLDSDTNDYSGNELNGASYGATQTTGNLGGAYDFEGSSYILTSDLTSFFDSDNLSVSAWFNANSEGVIVDELGQEAIDDGWHDSQVEIVGNDLYVGVWSGLNLYLGTVEFGTWHNVVFTFDEQASVFRGFLDGKEISNLTDAYRDNPVEYGNNYFYALGLGDGTNMGSGGYFNGKIDEFAIWNRSLSSAEISQLYNKGNGLSLK